MKKRILSLAVCLALTLSLLPATALAEGSAGAVKSIAIGYEGCTHDLSFLFGDDHCHAVAVDGFASGAGQVLSGPGWSYDLATCTLTLNNFHGTAIYIEGEYAGISEKGMAAVTVKLVGENTLTGNGKQGHAALDAQAASLILEGPGSLSITGEKNGITVTTNNGDYKAGTFGGGSLTLKNGAKVTVDGLPGDGSTLQSDQLIIDSGCSVSLTGSNNFRVGHTNNLVVNGTLAVRRTVAGQVGIPFAPGMYCTVGPNVTIKVGKDAATASRVLGTKAPQTSPIYGSVTILDFDFNEIFDYVEYREAGGTVAEKPTTPAANLAYARTQTITVDGKAVEFQAYALKDAKGNETNYVKLRDLAYVLNGSGKQFNVGWNGSVLLDVGAAYVPNGSEMTTPFSGDRPYVFSTADTKFALVDLPLELTAIVLTDDAGAGYTYYKLRDLGTTMGFDVGWNAKDGITVNTQSLPKPQPAADTSDKNGIFVHGVLSFFLQISDQGTNKHIKLGIYGGNGSDYYFDGPLTGNTCTATSDSGSVITITFTGKDTLTMTVDKDSGVEYLLSTTAGSYTREAQ